MRLLRPLQLVRPRRRRLQEGADVEGGSRAEEGGRRRRRPGPVLVGVTVVRAVDVVLAGAGDGGERVWRETAILFCVLLVNVRGRHRTFVGLLFRGESRRF